MIHPLLKRRVLYLIIGMLSFRICASEPPIKPIFEKTKSYIKQEIVSTFRSDLQTEAGELIGPMELVYAATLVPWNQEELFVAIHRSYKHHLDNLSIWKRTGDRYSLLESLDTSMPLNDMDISYLEFEPPKLLRYDNETFLHVHIIGYRASDDVIFRIQPDLALRKIEIENARKRYQDDKQLGPGEDIRMTPNNFFSDVGLRFEFSIWNDKEPQCCPTAGAVEGTYKMAKNYDPQKKDWITKIVVASYKRMSIKK